MIKVIGLVILAAILYYLQLNIYKKYWNTHLDIKVKFKETELYENETGSLLEVIMNAKRLPLHMLRVKFQTDRDLIFGNSKSSVTTDRFYRSDIFQINGGEKITRTLDFKAGKRGFYQIDQIDLVGSDLLMSANLFTQLSQHTELYVYPAEFVTEELVNSFKQLNGEMITKRHLLEDPFEYRGIREYQPYDDLRSINWKATAKTGELKVNQKNYTALNEVRIFINASDDAIIKREEEVENCFRIAATLCRELLKQGMRVGCFCNGLDLITEEPMMVPCNSGNGQLTAILRKLARIDTGKTCVSFANTFREMIFDNPKDTMTIFLTASLFEDDTAFLEEYGKNHSMYYCYVPCFEKTELKYPSSIANKIVRIKI